MFSDKKVEFIHLILKQGEQLEPHTNPFDVVFYPLQGKATLITPESETIYEPFVSIFVESSQIRHWKNEFDEDFHLLVVKILEE